MSADGAHGHSHSHSHSGAPTSPAGARVRRLLAAIVIPLIVFTAAGMVALWPRSAAPGNEQGDPTELVAATVTNVELRECSFPVEGETELTLCQEVRIALAEGKVGTFELAQASSISLRQNDTIYVDTVETTAANGTTSLVYSFYDFKRERPLILLGIIFVAVAVAVGRQRGLRSLIALVISLVILAKFMLPAITQGSSPILVSLVGASAVMLIALYLSHGVNARTTSAVIGTLASLAITGLLASLAVEAARFTGLSNESSAYLRATSSGIDIRGILLAGIIIGALGVLDDVTVTQSSAVWELHQTDPNLHPAELYRSAVRIGRDHIASAVNTLVLAYAGASLPLLLLFSQTGTPLGEVLNGEPVATEVVRMLAGSIGLMASVPITTALTALVVKADRPTTHRSELRRGPTKEFTRPKSEVEFRENQD